MGPAVGRVSRMGVGDVIGTLREHGGIVTAGVLRSSHPRTDIAAALAGNDVVRVGHGRYALRSAVPDAQHAVRLGAVVAGLSAAHWWGWSLAQEPELPVVAVPRNRHVEPERRSDVRVVHVDLRPDQIVHGDAARATPWGPRLPDLARVTDKLTTAVYVARTEPLTTSLAVLDSARRDGITSDRLHAALAREPNQWRERARTATDASDPRAANGFESLVRAIAGDVPGLRLVPQVTVLPGITCDLVDEVLGIVVGCDSWTYHAEKSAFARDMERYNALVLAGRLVLRIGRPLAISDPGQVRRHLANAVALRNGTGCAEASRLAGA
jgi:hypothetical protein